MRIPNDTTTGIWVFLNLARQNVTQAFEQTLRQNGLPSASWYDLLWGLQINPTGLRQFELEKMCLFDQTNLSRTIKQLVADGLVCQVTAKEDRRGRVLTITEKGKSLRLKMWQTYSQLMISEIEDKVPSDVAEQLLVGLQALSQDEQKARFQSSKNTENSA